MKIPLNSIKKLTKIEIEEKELIEKVFTQIGAVEDIVDLEKKYSGILVAKILEKAEHPDSDRLGVYQLNIGNDQKVQVVAGDKSLEVGDTVAYFTPGTKLPYNAKPESNENIVQKITLRGVESEGMMASAKELDISGDHTKVMRLDSSLIEGTAFNTAYGLNDTVIDIENKALANRADCFGILGVAREISAMQGLKFVAPDWYSNPDKNKPKVVEKLPLEIVNEAQVNCPRYMALVVEDVKIQPSPIWLQVELSKVGIRSINNVVDITNYLMVLTSQPLHAFDYDKVIEKSEEKLPKIVVRQAVTGEKLLGLNDKVIELDETMTVICDSKHPIALAGIIGGKDTEIDENTKNIIIEVANFNRYNIRKTSWKTGVFTDAASRFTKAQDPNQCKAVLYQAIRMCNELADGSVASKVIDSYPVIKDQVVLELDVKKANLITGLKLSKKQMIEILVNINYEVEDLGDKVKLKVPTYRQDVNIIEDVYEDISRIFGFNSISVTLPFKSITPAPIYKAWELKQEVRNILSSIGANELLTYNFISSLLLSNYKIDPNIAYHIKNSLSPDLEFMRVNLVPSLLEKLKENLNRGYSNQTLFEINIGHNKREIDNENLPIERWTLAVVNTKSSQDNTLSHYYNVKSIVDVLEKKLNLKTLGYTLVADVIKDELPIWIQNILGQHNENRAAVITYEQDSKKYYLGILGELSNEVLHSNGLPLDTSSLEIDLSTLSNALSAFSSYQEPSRFPKITQDLCFVMNTDIQFNAIKQEILSILKSTHMYFELEVIDIYASPKQPETKQMTFRLSLQSRDKTLEGWEFDKVKKKVIHQLEEKFKTKLI